jgi:hypothetical protein
MEVSLLSFLCERRRERGREEGEDQVELSLFFVLGGKRVAVCVYLTQGVLPSSSFVIRGVLFLHLPTAAHGTCIISTSLSG